MFGYEELASDVKYKVKIWRVITTLVSPQQLIGC